MRQGRVYRRCSTCGGDVNAKTKRARPPRHARCDGTAFSWTFTVDVAPVGAPREQIKRGGFPTKKEALAAMAGVQASASDGAYVEPSRQTLGDYLDEWLAGMRGEYAPGTWDAANLHVRSYIKPRIGDVPLRAITRRR